MINDITLRSVTEGADRIHGYLKDGQFDHENATKEANDLYQKGVKLVIAEVQKNLSIKDSVFPVVKALNDIILDDKTYTLSSFHQSLSKVYRIFIELTWYQCYCQRSWQTLNKTRDSIIENSKNIISVLPKNEISTRFEYRCAEQAAKCLKVVESFWKKSPEHILNIGESAEGTSFFGIIKGFQGFIKDARNDWVHEWYLYIHELRWLSANIKTQEDFKNIIGVRLKNFQEKGNKYTICLALIFVDLIKNPEVTENVRKLAAKGLADLFIIREHGDIIAYLAKLLSQVKFTEKAAIKADRYWKTRFLIMQSLEELAKDPAYKEYIRVTADRLANKVHHNQRIHIEEKEQIRKKLESLQGKNEEIQESIEQTQSKLTARKKDKQRSDDHIQQSFNKHNGVNLLTEQKGKKRKIIGSGLQASFIEEDMLLSAEKNEKKRKRIDTQLAFTKQKSIKLTDEKRNYQRNQVNIQALEAKLKKDQDKKVAIKRDLEKMHLFEKVLEEIHSEEKNCVDRLDVIRSLCT
ncbi:coiled-coil domain-containing protein [Candidatus Protochlamydia amoebophila]|uniref:Uncharacterized protein n=1 Tax=Candidatus Protochlamydia amoebophila TaxID=362787 RepID=A0A0C1JTA5_9BACT|nr:hypothetical protein [Candidatus Protochlamydia amoebophila]KIC74340.1 hypothetical protein DB44_AL00340 [Candidatus Protochlamydia amoebophila]